jgi:hypothetical protein
VALVVAASAFGQGATLVVTPNPATPGTVVTVTGSAFNPSNANVASGVNLRLDTRDAEPLANTNPTTQGTISVSFPLPAATPLGEHLLIGTQTSVRGRHTFGGPGRARLRVVAAGKSSAAAVGGWSPGDMPPAAIAGSILALIALVGGAAFGVRRLRTPGRRTQPNLSR